LPETFSNSHLYRIASVFHEEEKDLKKNYKFLEIYTTNDGLMPRRSAKVSIPFNKDVVHHFETYFYRDAIELNNKVYYDIYESKKLDGLIEKIYISFDKGIIGIRATDAYGQGDYTWMID